MILNYELTYRVITLGSHLDHLIEEGAFFSPRVIFAILPFSALSNSSIICASFSRLYCVVVFGSTWLDWQCKIVNNKTAFVIGRQSHPCLHETYPVFSWKVAWWEQGVCSGLLLVRLRVRVRTLDPVLLHSDPVRVPLYSEWTTVSSPIVIHLLLMTGLISSGAKGWKVARGPRQTESLELKSYQIHRGREAFFPLIF